ncbi:hypothetical protein AT1G53260 [Arabidopsis thaliana]|uniref:MORF/ORRM1/DAG-like MORF domain-containing protein n=1 Tax=Arabidopsis thaliana TaxID=3702 RepID=A8MS36_ARATH|nr:uncharacterized protein AT1G53260 [Arabidopsis thaliana]AEE32913.1 hypothetical protein AT1G53260 [Arabidopsis thaliana]|eukprot:NP_001077709.1 hypothetical protein AT1G53260 [Arabidopsis thaliana]
MKIYSVSHKCYFAFGALVSEDLSHKIKELPKVKWVLPDSYLDGKNKDYGGEPFIDGKAVPYDPKYHEEWIRNNANATNENRRPRRPRNSDGGRNDRGNQDTGYRRPPPNQGMGGAPPPPPHIGNNPNMPPHIQPPNMNQNYRGTTTAKHEPELSGTSTAKHEPELSGTSTVEHGPELQGTFTAATKHESELRGTTTTEHEWRMVWKLPAERWIPTTRSGWWNAATALPTQ